MKEIPWQEYTDLKYGCEGRVCESELGRPDVFHASPRAYVESMIDRDLRVPLSCLGTKGKKPPSLRADEILARLAEKPADGQENVFEHLEIDSLQRHLNEWAASHSLIPVPSADPNTSVLLHGLEVAILSERLSAHYQAIRDLEKRAAELGDGTLRMVRQRAAMFCVSFEPLAADR